MPTRDEILINTRLAGAREFVGAAEAEAAALGELGLASETVGTRFEHATRRSWLFNQAMFTTRRIVYGGTLAILGIGAASLKMGFDFDSSMQTATVAMTGFLGSTDAATNYLAKLYNLAAYTPLRFTDITNAARLMLGFGFSAQDTYRYLSDIVDMLTAMGVDSPASIRRVSIALGHMENIGYVTGQTLLQLARDNIPVYEILQQQLGLTAEQLHNIGKMHIPADVVMQAIARGIESDPRYHGAAQRLALTTFHGLFTTMQDFAAQFFGNVEKPIFSGAQDVLRGMVKWFQLLGNAAQESGGNLDYIMSVVDQRLPGALMLWRAFAGVVSNTWHIFTFFVSSMARSHLVWGTILVSLEMLRGVLWFVRQNMALIVSVMKIAIPIFIAWVVWHKAMVLWSGILAAVEIAETGAIRKMTFAQFLLSVALGRYSLLAKAATAITWLYVVAQTALTAATEYLTVSLYALMIWLELNPLIAIISAVVLLTAGLVILYFKWQRFHDFVNGMASAIWNGLIAPFKSLYDVIKQAYDMAEALIGLLPGHSNTGHHFDIKDYLKDVLGIAKIVVPFGGGRASGGSVFPGSMYLAGERGPELVSFARPGYVHNTDETRGIFSHPEAWMQRGQRQPIVLQVTLDKRVIAEAVADVDLSMGARA